MKAYFLALLLLIPFKINAQTNQFDNFFSNLTTYVVSSSTNFVVEPLKLNDPIYFQRINNKYYFIKIIMPQLKIIHFDLKKIHIGIAMDIDDYHQKYPKIVYLMEP